MNVKQNHFLSRVNSTYHLLLQCCGFITYLSFLSVALCWVWVQYSTRIDGQLKFTVIRTKQIDWHGNMVSSTMARYVKTLEKTVAAHFLFSWPGSFVCGGIAFCDSFKLYTLFTSKLVTRVCPARNVTTVGRRGCHWKPIQALRIENFMK